MDDKYDNTIDYHMLHIYVYVYIYIYIIIYICVCDNIIFYKYYYGFPTSFPQRPHFSPGHFSPTASPPSPRPSAARRPRPEGRPTPLTAPRRFSASSAIDFQRIFKVVHL